MYFKYKIQKYIYVFSILKILYKIQNGTMASNVFHGRSSDLLLGMLRTDIFSCRNVVVQLN